MRDLAYYKKKIETQERKIRKLESLIKVNSIIASSLTKTVVIKNILAQTKKIMNCEKSSILLVDKLTNKLKFVHLSSEEEKKYLSDIRLKKGEGIAGFVWEHGKPLLIKDVRKDHRFCNKADKKTKNITISLIAVPLVVDGKIIGIMEAINKADGKYFDKFDLEICTNFSTQASIALNNSKLYELAITDGLTGLFIHRYFKQCLSEEFSRARRYKNNLSLVIFDLDHFKCVNDNYGHLAGDSVLKNISKILKANCRASDIPCRYGGEELSVILPETDLEGAQIFAEKIRKLIEDFSFTYNKEDTINVTISGGIVALTQHQPNTIIEFIRMADESLYYSKEHGRNRISLYSDIKKLSNSKPYLFC